MGKKLKTNKVLQIRESEMRKLERKWVEKGSILTMVSFLTVMHDKEGYGAMRLERVFKAWEKLSDEIGEGRVNLFDLKKTLEEEQHIVFRVKKEATEHEMD